MNLRLRKHVGVVLEPSTGCFDAAGSAWGCIFQDPVGEDYYLYYSGCTSTSWRKASIGVAKSTNGTNFVKYDGKPLISVYGQCITPTVFEAHGKYWMAFAYSNGLIQPRSLALASADEPLGPWKVLGQLITPRDPWEGDSIDLGPSVVNLTDEDHLIYYSNATCGKISRVFYGRRLVRRLGVLKIEISDSGKVRCERWDHNPLVHLNGKRGAWNESLFCPGYIKSAERHYLFPATSLYSSGKPFKQYVGLIEDFGPFFQNPTYQGILINGPQEKNHIISNTRSEIAFDTPCPVMRDDELWLYYACMDRADLVWKTALSIYSIR
jgi:hypothetical protein